MVKNPALPPSPAGGRSLDNPKRFRHVFFMADHTLKNILEESHHRAQRDARNAARHTRWVMEALQSGPAKLLLAADLGAAFAHGIHRAKTRGRIR